MALDTKMTPIEYDYNIITNYPLVIVETSNGITRLCLDPKDLIVHIKREHYHLRHKSEIIADMQLDEASTMLCTMTTPYGRYSFKIMPYGISSAPEIFHKKIIRITESLDGVDVFIDDILILVCTKEEHDWRLQNALERMKATNLKLKSEQV